MLTHIVVSSIIKLILGGEKVKELEIKEIGKRFQLARKACMLNQNDIAKEKIRFILSFPKNHLYLQRIFP